MGGEDVEFGLRLLDSDAGVEASDDVESVIVVLFELLGSEGRGNPKLLETSGGIVARRHDSDDGVGQTIDLDGLAERGGAVSETISPNSVADDDDAVSAGLRFVLGEDASGSGRDVEDLEEVGGNRRAGNAFGKCAEGDVV